MSPIAPDPYWDAPDGALDACDDMFAIFAFNEASISRLRALGMCESHVLDVRAAMDLSYRNERRNLMQLMVELPREERLKEGFLTTWIPQLVHWANGDLLGLPGRNDHRPHP